MNDIAKFIEELVAKNVADVLGTQKQQNIATTFEKTNTNENGDVVADIATTVPLLAQLAPRERLVFMAQYNIADHLGHCLTPTEVRQQLMLTKREYNRILDAARKKLV